MKKIFTSPALLKGTLTALISASLVACGGGGEGPQASFAMPDLEVVAGDIIDISGHVETSNNLLSSISWTVAPVKATQAQSAMALLNGNCAEAQKHDVPLAVPGKIATGRSDWSCAVGLITPLEMAVDTQYNVSLIGIDDRGVRHTSTKTLLVKTNPDYKPDVLVSAAGKDFTVLMGQTTAALHCDGLPSSSYQWVVLDNAGLPLVLSSYNGADTMFTAPAVTKDTNFTLQCRETNALTGRVRSSNVVVTVATNLVNTLVASIGPLDTATPGTRVDLTGNSAWFGKNGSATTGPLVTNTWSLDAAAIQKGYQLISSTGATTQLLVPNNVAKAEFVSITLTSTSGDAASQTVGFKPSTSAVTTLLRVDPYAVLTPSVSVTLAGNSATPSVVAGSAGYYLIDEGMVGSATANFGAPAGATLFYRWTVVEGANILRVSSVNTKSIGFVAPIVTVDTTIRMRVDVAYGAPVNDVSNPPVYTTDVVFLVGPEPEPVPEPAPAPAV